MTGFCLRGWGGGSRKGAKGGCGRKKLLEAEKSRTESENEKRMSLVGDALIQRRFPDTQGKDCRQSGGIWGQIPRERGDVEVVRS